MFKRGKDIKINEGVVIFRTKGNWNNIKKYNLKYNINKLVWNVVVEG